MHQYTPSHNDRRRISHYSPYPHERPYNSYDTNRGTEPMPYRTDWNGRNSNSSINYSQSSTNDGRRYPPSPGSNPYDPPRQYRPNNSFQGLVPPSFRDRPESSNISYRKFSMSPPREAIPPRDVPMSSNDLSHAPRPFQSNNKYSYGSERGPSDAQSYISKATSNSGTWPAPNRIADGWPAVPPPPNNSVRPNTYNASKFEPSDGWKRTQEERDRRLSYEQRAIIPAEHRNNSPQPYPETRRTSGSYDAFDQRNEFEASRYDQDSPRVSLPSSTDRGRSFPTEPPQRPQQYSSYNLANPRPAFGKKPLHRQSARISARPRRSPSPSSASTASSASGNNRASRPPRSGSESRSQFSSAGGAPRSNFNRLSNPWNSSSQDPSPERPISRPRNISNVDNHSHASNYPQSNSQPSSREPYRPRNSPPRRYSPQQPFRQSSETYERRDSRYNISRSRSYSRSASPRGSQSSIRSSSHSSPEIFPEPLPNTEPTIVSSESIYKDIGTVSSLPAPMSIDDVDFELPGMRFQKDGALKPGLESVPALNLDIHIGTSESPNPPTETQESPMEIDIVEESASPVRLEENFPTRDLAKPNDPPFPAQQEMEIMKASSLQPLPSEWHAPSPIVEDPAPPSMEQVFPTTENREQPKPSVSLDISPPRVEQSVVIVKAPVVQQSRALIQAPAPPPHRPVVPPRSQENRYVALRPPVVLKEVNATRTGAMSVALHKFLKARDTNTKEIAQNLCESILRSNQTLVDAPITRPAISNERLVQEAMNKTQASRRESHAKVSQNLLERFNKRAEDLTEKNRRLRAEYKAHHDRWTAHCRRLDKVMAASNAEGVPQRSTRSSRRSGFFGDAARSDLEMEQIIASLGSEDMTDPNVLAMHNMAVIPDLISTTDEAYKLGISYLDDNGMVDDPVQNYNVYEALGAWTAEERDIFLKKYAAHPKQFGAISAAIPGKTTSQCILFYYLHKKDLIDFRAVIAQLGPKRKRGRKAKGKSNALLADIRKQVGESEEIVSTDTKHAYRFTMAGRAAAGRRANLIMPTLVKLGSVPKKSAAPLVQTVASPVQAIAPPIVPPAQAVAPPAQTTVQTIAFPAAPPVPAPMEVTTLQSHDKETPIQTPMRRISPSEDGAEMGTIVVAPQKKKKKSVILSTEPSSAAGVEQALIAPKPVEKPKEKVKRPPGRPPKKNKQQQGTPGASGSTQKTTTTSYVWTQAEGDAYEDLLAIYGRDFVKIAADMPAKTALQCRNYYRNHSIDLEPIAEEAERRLKENPPSAVGDSVSSKTDGENVSMAAGQDAAPAGQDGTSAVQSAISNRT